jgi:NTP pyrophosphatase (non-canonical NTP hydrolase)
VAKLAAARKRKKVETGAKVEGRKSHAEKNPELVALVRELHRKPRKGDRMSLRQIAEELAARGLVNANGQPYNPKSVAAMLKQG